MKHAEGNAKQLASCSAFRSVLYYHCSGCRVLGVCKRAREVGGAFRFSGSLLDEGALALVGIGDRSQIQYGARCLYQIMGQLYSEHHHSVSSTLRLLAKFLWGWHGRMSLVTAFVVPLQMLGVYSVLSRRRSAVVNANEAEWGSRSLGSLCLLGGAVLASVLVSLPICAGRVVLFAQIHTQILAIEERSGSWAR